MPLMNARAYLSSEALGLKVGVGPRLHSYFVYASSEGSCESAQYVPKSRALILLNPLTELLIVNLSTHKRQLFCHNARATAH